MNKYLFAFLAWIIFLSNCSQNQDSIKFKQYQHEGERLYAKYCQNCHKDDGKGFKNLYPSLNNVDFLKNKNKVACLIKNGISEEIVVNGVVFNLPMPPNQELTDLEIAEILTFIYTKWNGETSITTINFVRGSLDSCQVN